MTDMSDRDAAAQLAKRIDVRLADPSKADEAGRPQRDKSPGYADVLMSEAPASIEKAVDLKPNDWVLISKALKHYAACEVP
jgi:hypothetical protein